ncbi:acyl-CoA N-acyltransferase [Schizothecium vesticola]|uniref:Acyl-CoA N-acyltransferase n=1 Tax=Schizothecium vesticola TaxID=314040 RepID=A0AA40ELF3_9PEZI|nr:acyl-CoA N-acyltransferase [Schizothecium vesticola]
MPSESANPFLTTPRLLLLHPSPSSDTHCDFFVALYNTPEFLASIGGRPTSITTRAAARNLLATKLPADLARNGYGTYLVCLRPAPDTPKDVEPEPIGIVTLMRGEEPNRYRAPDLGFAVLPRYVRRGYAKEAGGAVVEWFLERGEGEGLFGFCSPGNEASRGVLRSLGFKGRGVHKLRVFGGEEADVWTLRMEGGVEGWGL